MNEMSKKPILSVFSPVENIDNDYNDTWLDNLDQFNNMLNIQESRFITFMENIGTEKNPNCKQNHELAANLAAKYLEDGNAFVDIRNYELAITCYKEGVLLDYPNKDLRVDLLNHLSATYFVLNDYSSSLASIEQLFKLEPDHNVALAMAVKCCLQLNMFDQSLIYCNKYLEKNKGSPEEELEKYEFKKKIEHKRLINELKKKKSNLSQRQNGAFFDDLKTFNIKYPGQLRPVHLNQTCFEGNCVPWPVIFTCPEYEKIVFVRDFHENTTFYGHLKDIFSQRPIWDVKGEYTADTVNIYYDYPDGSESKLIKVEAKTCTLADVLKIIRYPMEFGVPTFMIFVIGGRHEIAALTDYPTYMEKWMKSINRNKLLTNKPNKCRLGHCCPKRNY